MGKKKGGNGGQQLQQQQKPAPQEGPPPAAEAPAPQALASAPASVQVEQKDVDTLSLEEAREEIRALRKQLADRDAASRAGPDSEDMMKLQERLQQLRNEQREADAAKDAAWRQLKSVVNKISELAQQPAQKEA